MGFWEKGWIGFWEENFFEHVKLFGLLYFEEDIVKGWVIVYGEFDKDEFDI
jgi:hypothetical protein